VLWATLEGEDAKLWRARCPTKALPRRKAGTMKEALKLQKQIVADLKSGRDPHADNPIVADYMSAWIDQRKLADSTLALPDLLALMALRAAMEREFAEALNRIDRQIEQETEKELASVIDAAANRMTKAPTTGS
jgi:hypothetical protein